MYSRFGEEGIYDPERFDWSSAETFFEQRKDFQAHPLDSGIWEGWSDELDSVRAGAIVFPPTGRTIYR
jgi:hypothetical protein